VRAVPHRNLVAPPELPRDAPVGRILERVDRETVLALRVVAHLAGAERLERTLLDLVHRAPPLQRDERLDPRVAAFARRDAVAVVLALLEQPALAAPGEDLLFRLLLRQPFETLGGLETVGADAARLREPMVAADLEVGR